ncbi:MAG: Coenzyme F420 hydrogenase/dehydrogenase, beta subunit C-terminal domain [Lachnospiraceae bacterium]|nr:Coenzyme F420 hydrogenase/dehydrogenase, beta subunit C-terminal domain [Lachnospiraceae bacterium]
MEGPNLKKEWNCSVCGRCVLACPNNAIGFKIGKVNYEPSIDREKCISCKQCEKACLGHLERFDDNAKTKSYICASKDLSVLKDSSSGGIFTELALFVLENKGIVLGASFDHKDKVIKHIAVDNSADLYRCRKSKYVQSDPTLIYEIVRQSSETGRMVLVTGTPCQIAPIKRKYELFTNILCVDLYCHGATNPVVFRDYLNSVGDIEHVDFRTDGAKGNFYFSIHDKNGINSIKWCYDDPFYKSFIYGYNFKENCYDCEFSQNTHISDITIGDWNYGNKEEYSIHPSIVTLNTDAGYKAFDMIKERLKYSEIENVSKIQKYYYSSHRTKKGEWGYNKKLTEEFVNAYFLKNEDSSIISLLESTTKKAQLEEYI